ncbi:MAG: type II secretion system protein [Dehalococcoidia bacterium]|nr:MAG: type II secretion system protein [Dehalococcoidia bacterium]
MKRSERGFSLTEVMVATGVIALIVCGAATAAVQTINVTKRSNDHMTTIRQAQNAGYWISRDTQMAENVIVDDDPLTPEFLTITWTEWGYDIDSKYHSATYSFQDLSDGIGKLKRDHSIYDDAGVEIEKDTTLVAEYVYFDTDDPGNPNNTNASYQSPVLTLQTTASLGEASETKEYQAWRRPNFSD